MKYALVLIMLILPAGTGAAADECVVLLHGLGRTAISMKMMESSLEKSGYLVWNQGYLSRTKTIEELSVVVGAGIDYCREKKAKQIHFVTHSLGGILVRHYFQDHTAGEAKRVVMLGPPNHGSELADRYKDAWWYKEATGPAGQQLGTGLESLLNKLKPVPLEIGIIAGNSGNDPLFSGNFDMQNDGKVSVESTKLDEMKDFIIVDSGHTFIMNSREVIRQAACFLREGKFDTKPADAGQVRKTENP